MGFNQKLEVPDFISKRTKGRRLEEGDLDDIDVGSIFDVTMASKGDEGSKAAEFFLNIQEWTEDGLKLKMNFTNPLSVSKGRNSDALIIKIKNPSLFVSQESGAFMDLSKQDK